MSDFPESKKSSINPGLDASPKPMSGPVSASAQQSSSASGQQPASTPIQPNIVPVQAPQDAATTSHLQAPTQDPAAQFKAENIGNWAAQQEDYFAEQNRKAEEKRKKSERTRRKVLPIVFIVGGIIAVGLIIWGIVALVIALTTKPEPEIPVISGGTSADIGNYRNILQEFFNKNNGNIDAVDDAVNDVLDTDGGKEYADQIKMSQASFLMANGYNEKAATIAEQINPDSLSTEQKSMLYSLLAVIYSNLGDFEKANHYNELMYQVNLELGGDGGA